ncbi:MAG: DUF480 domain-containing protein [Acidobacteria bacterium]|nr:DUF480 domain-containing protein [Acidobacteriota bacterium]
MDVTPQHARVLACLIEKAETTRDSYPLSTNALCAACNQSTNRNPVVDYSEREVDAAMLELRQFGLARTVRGTGHRVGKHKHVVDEALDLDGDELAVLAVLVLRGAQTLREIVTRTARYEHGPAGDESAVDAAIGRLAARSEPFITRLERRSGEREPRIVQCWVQIEVDGQASSAAESSSGAVTAAIDSPNIRPAQEQSAPSLHAEPRGSDDRSDVSGSLEDRVVALETIVAEQRRRLDRIAEELGFDDS